VGSERRESGVLAGGCGRALADDVPAIPRLDARGVRKPRSANREYASMETSTPTTQKSIAALRHLIRFINVAKEYIVTLFDPLESGLGRSTSTPECVRASNAVLGSFGLGQSASRQQYGDFGQEWQAKSGSGAVRKAPRASSRAQEGTGSTFRYSECAGCRGSLSTRLTKKSINRRACNAHVFSCAR
jgi:hypothetical protein